MFTILNCSPKYFPNKHDLIIVGYIFIVHLRYSCLGLGLYKTLRKIVFQLFIQSEIFK